MSNYEYLTPKELVESKAYPFRIAQLRHYLLHRHKNGLDKATRKVGKVLLIRVDLFEEWIESYKEAE